MLSDNWFDKNTYLLFAYSSYIKIVHNATISYIILMLHLIVSLLLIVVLNDVVIVAGWNPANFSFNPGDSYELVFQDEFENVGPVQAIINGKPAYSPNPKNWAHIIGPHHDDGIENYTDSIQNSYVQNGQLNIVAMKEGYQSAMLTSADLQEFTFGMFASKIRLPYGKGIWPAWWMYGHDHQTNLNWPTVGEIDILEMWGGNSKVNFTDQYAHGTLHWNNQSNTMNPVYNKYIGNGWGTPDGSMLHNNSLVYWAEWTPINISIGVNEFTYFQMDTTNLPESINPSWAFSGRWPYRLLLDIAINPLRPGPPDNTTVWPQQMVVDWVRVYQKKKTQIAQEV
jgi:beta-glucanase (GH16 family)